MTRNHVFHTDGTSGPIHTSARVNYYIQPSTASADLDYMHTNGTLFFAPGSTEEVIHIDIYPDDIPEVSESFEIILNVLEGDVVLKEPSKVTVTINGNDDPNGIFSFNTNSSSLEDRVDNNKALYLSEDSEVLSVFIEVVRRGGSYGEVSMDWELAELGGKALIVSGIRPHGGHLVFRDTEREKQLMLMIEQNDLPETAQKYQMSLLSHTLQGKIICLVLL